jgi:CRP/FNR family transcriptional regulator, cyclic AMP receptor protein
MAQGKGPSPAFDPGTLLSGQGAGQSRLRLAPQENLFMQGDASDAAYYVESGWALLTVITPNGKEAATALRGKGDFLGTRCLIGPRRTGTGTALTACSLIRISKPALLRMLREESDFAVMLAAYLVRQGLEDQKILVEQMTSSAEKRLAGTLVRLAAFDHHEGPTPISARINQTTLAKMVGTTRSRVNFFMNKFKRDGLIEYNRAGDVRVRKALQDVALDP